MSRKPDKAGTKNQSETVLRYAGKSFLWMLLSLGIAILSAVGAARCKLDSFGNGTLIFLIAALAIVLLFNMRKWLEHLSLWGMWGTMIALSVGIGVLSAGGFSNLDLRRDALSVLAGIVCFGAVAVCGWTVKRDLAKLEKTAATGVTALIALDGISLMYPGPTVLNWAIYLLAFSLGLGHTAFCTQQLRAFYDRYSARPEMRKKASIYSAGQMFVGLYFIICSLNNFWQ